MTKEDKTFEAELPKEKSTWDLIVETANTPEEKADIRRVYRDSEINELERLKSEQIKTYPNKIGYYRSDGTKADFKTFNEINRPIRQRVTEILKDREKVNKFMRLKKFERKYDD